MIQKIPFIVCENEHGLGDEMYPDIEKLDKSQILDLAARKLTAADIRREAERLGWRRIYGADYCPQCAVKEELAEEA
jgi:hypothetical protein